MLERFVSLQDQFIEIQEAEDSDIYIDTTQKLLTKERKFAAMLAEINILAKRLKIRGRTLAKCREDLDVLLKARSEENNYKCSPLYQFKFEKK